MDARRKEIDQLGVEIARLEQQITGECVEIGRRLASFAPSRLRREELKKYLNSFEALRRSAASFGDDIDRIRALVRRIADLKDELEENARRRVQVERERKSRFVELGAGSYSLYRSLSGAEGYREVFEEALKLDLEIERHHQTLRELEEEQKTCGFLRRQKIRWRKLGLRGGINRLDRAKTAAYERAGAKLADSDFGRIATGPLQAVFDFVGDRGKAMETLAAEGKRKEEELEGHRAELKRLGAETRHEERITEIEGRIRGVEKEVDVVACWIGQHFLEHDLAREIDDANLEAKSEIVAGLRESIERKRGRIGRLRAELEIEEITRREKAWRARRRELDAELRDRERQINAIDLEINAGLKRLEELRKVIEGEAPYTEVSPVPPVEDRAS